MRVSGLGTWMAGLAMIGALSLGGVAAGAQVAGKAPAPLDRQIQTYVQQKLASNKNLAGVHAAVDDQVVTLSGTVPDYRAKLQADHDVRQISSVNGVINRIQVGGPSVPDSQLQRELSDRLAYDRMFMGQTFNNLNLKVQDGIVTVGGQVVDYPSRDSALDIIADTKGVKGVVDDIAVAPLSPMDEQIRYQAARAIYGNPAMTQYANNPAHPIRIVVKNGRVTLEGVVNSQVDKQIAGNAVRSLPGVFGVQNNLVVSH